LALSAAPGSDPRAAYDVRTYRLDLSVDPRTKTLSGTVAIEAVSTDPALSRLVLDLQPPLEVQSVVELDGALTPEGSLAGTALAFERKEDALSILLRKGVGKGQAVRVAVRYSGQPKEHDSFDGFHWKKTPSGKPWICTSSQGTGSSAWWPGKDSYWHPEDKPDRTFVNLTVPEGLVGVSNGRLAGREKSAAGTETFRWIHDYPCETYAIAISVAPYVEVARELEIPGAPGAPSDKVPFAYYVVPEDLEKAKLQFAEVPEMLAIYSRAFGAYPFPKSKFALVQANFWGMEHSTCIAYGSSFPAWCRAYGADDPYETHNERFDYILVHESAHEWWGNAVSAESWGHFWIHEGFATYAEAVYLEEKEGAEAAQAHLADMEASIGRDARLFRGENVDSGEAYAHDLYTKGAWVLHTLRHYVDDDDLWWRALRDFNLAHRYGSADTDDFRKVLEDHTQKSWKTFFEEWFLGEGYPILDGTVTAKARSLSVQVSVEGSGKTRFHVPIDLVWREGQEPKHRRVMLEPGQNRIEIPTRSKPRGIGVTGLERVLGEQSIRFQ